MKRSKFSLSNYKLFSCDMGFLIPCGLQEVLPGDTFQQATSALVRCSPLLAPVMHPVHIRIHHWFVPHRLVWDEWEDFITGGEDGMDASVFPTIPSNTYNPGTLPDYMGLPVGSPVAAVSALPFRAYALIYNEWYRDQDLQTEVTVNTGSGVDNTTSLQLMRCGWEKDYFTSSRPWEQKGPSVSIPVTGSGVIEGLGIITGSTTVANQTVADFSGTSPTYTNAYSTGIRTRASGVNGAPDVDVNINNASITVNALREAMALQRFQEARARFGSRYVEYLRYLGVRSSDARLQRPEYLGGGKQTIQFSEVLQTAEGSDPVGEMRGHGISAMRSNRYRRFFEEHGYVISLFSVRPKTIYAHGIHRTFNRRIKEDFWQRELQHIGQQEVLNKEIYGFTSGSPDAVFGYQDRYDEYRRAESSVAGEFRTTLLNYWHMARTFASQPALNASFVECLPTERTFAVPDQHVIYVMAKHSIQARRLVASTGKSYIF